MIADWILALLPTLALFVLAYLSALQLGGWLAPSALFCLYWGAAQLGVLILGADLGYRPIAALFFLVAGLIVCGSVHLGASTSRPQLKLLPSGRVQYDLWQGFSLLLLFSAGGLIAIYILISSEGFSILDLLSVDGITAISQRYVGLRYAEGIGLPRLANSLNSLLYAAALFAGLALATTRSAMVRLACALPPAIGLAQAVLTTARTAFIWLAVYMVAAYLCGIVLTHRERSIASLRAIVLAGLFGCMLVVVYFAIQVLREGTSLVDSPVALLKTRVGALGSPLAFSLWLEHGAASVDPLWGGKSLGGLFELLGGRLRTAGVGWEFSTIIGPSEIWQTNVYTGFRQLIEDYTILGALGVLIPIGFLAGVAYVELKSGAVEWLPVLALFYSTTLSSYIANPLYYNSVLFSWAPFSAFLILGGRHVLRHRPFMVRLPSAKVRVPVQHTWRLPRDASAFHQGVSPYGRWASEFHVCEESRFVRGFEGSSRPHSWRSRVRPRTDIRDPAL